MIQMLSQECRIQAFVLLHRQETNDQSSVTVKNINPRELSKPVQQLIQLAAECFLYFIGVDRHALLCGYHLYISQSIGDSQANGLSQFSL